MESTKLGAPAAYRGYRLQALYVLYKLLIEKDGGTISPEKAEDLSIKDQEGEFTEIIQIKAYSSKDLGYSDLKSNTDSVFKRIVKYIDNTSPPKLKIVSFDPIGPELSKGFGGKEKEKKKLEKKLTDDGFNVQEIEFIFNVSLVQHVSEDSIRQEIDILLQDIPSGSSLNASFDLLNHWLYICSEFQIEITKENLIAKLLSIGKDVNESIAYQQHWFKTITPLRNEIQLTSQAENDAFYNGSLTNYSHVVFDLDIRREEWITKLKQSHEQYNLVILHGPSGQGKTTLAYRYMYECFPEHCRIEIKKIQDIDKALEIAQALSGFATRVKDVPIGIYLDISPRETNWVDLIREMVDFRNVYVLVTIREEDWKRAVIQTDNLLFTDVSIDFSKQEAEKFFNSATKQLKKIIFLDFEDAWIKFGEQGPLLEFAYFLNNEGITLKEKIRKQILRIEDECQRNNSYNSLNLLKLVAVASKYNCRLKIRDVIKELNILGQADIAYLEGEYLVKINKEENMFEGLHQIRSSIIESLLVDEQITYWNDLAKVCLKLMPEEDLKTFLMQSFYDGKFVFITNYILNPNLFSVKSWTGVGGVLESLLWLGVQEYFIENIDLISELKQRFNHGWSVYFFDVAQVLHDRNPIEQMLVAVNAKEEQLEEAKAYKDKQTDRNHVYKYVRIWISCISYHIDAPTTKLDHIQLGYVSFWMGHLIIHTELIKEIEEIDFNFLINGNLSSKEISQIVFGLLQIRSEYFNFWYQSNYNQLILQYRKENNVIKMQCSEKELKIYTLIEAFDDKESEDKINLESNNKIHDITMDNILILRKLVPTKEMYSHQGVGHKLFDSLLNPYSLDDSQKNIPIENLHLEILTSINSLFRILAEYRDRPETWEQFFSFVIERRKSITDYFNTMNELLFSYHKTKNADYLVQAVSKLSDEQLNHLLKQSVLLPQIVIDSCSWQDENSWRISEKKGNTTSTYLVHLKKYALFLQSIKNYFTDVSNFLQNNKLVFLYHCKMVKNTLTPLQKANIKIFFDQFDFDEQNGWATFININNTVLHLQDFQLQFEKVFKDSFIKDPVWLSQFAAEETETMQIARSYWFELISNREKIYYHPKRDILRTHKELLTQLKNKILNGLKEIEESADQLIISIREEDKLFIIEYCYAENILLTFSLHEKLIQFIRKICEKIHYRELIYHEMEKNWSKFVFIPKFKGKSVLNLYWEIPFYAFTSMNEEIALMHFIPKTIPDNLMQKLEIHTGNTLKTEESMDLLYNFMSLTAIFKHLDDINNLEDTDDTGIEILKKYLLKFYCQQSEHYQKILDSLSVMLNKISGLINDSQEEYIIDMALYIFQEIQKIQPTILPEKTSDDKIELEISLSEMGTYASKFESISINIWIVTLLWVELSEKISES